MNLLTLFSSISPDGRNKTTYQVDFKKGDENYIRLLRKSYYDKMRYQKKKNSKKWSMTNKKNKGGNVGKVYRGRTKYIDVETKPERDYVVVIDDGERVKVAKLKSIKIFDENGKNADKALVEINSERYGLKVRTGVDYQKFDKNRMSKQRLRLSDKRVFPEQKERFSLNSKDKHNVLIHTKAIQKPKNKKKRSK